MVEPTSIPTETQQLLDLVQSLQSELEEVRKLADDRRREAKWNERQLKTAEAAYNSLVENLPVGLIRKDLEGVMQFVNQPVCKEFGLPLIEIVGKTDYDFFPHELAEKYRADDHAVIQSGEVFEDVESHRTPEGDWRYVHVIKAPVIDADGETVGVQLIFWDETDRKRAEEELKASEARKRAIFETSLDCLIISNEQGQIVEFNRAAEQTFGYTRAEALGQDMDELLIAPTLPIDDQRAFRRFSVIGEESSLLGKRLEVPLVRRNGEEFIAEMAMQPIPLEGTVHYATVLHDITNRKRNEAALQNAKEAAEAASQAKSAFLANMSHEIRTPMNAILGMTSLVLDTSLQSEQRENLLIVQDSTESLLSLINDILDFSKIEAGRLDLHPATFPLRDRIGDTMKSLSNRAHDKGLELACHISPDVPDHLIGDIGRLRQIIINLIGNAIKFTDTGEVVLDIGVESRGNAEVDLKFTVTDTGIGIPPDRQDTIFEVFEQVDSSTTRRFGGTGLGLAISTRLVQLMNGRIWVESQVGAGSTFCFTAQLGVADEQDSGLSEHGLDSLSGLSVLIVDDNETNLHILQEMLQNWGMHVALANNAPDALTMLRESGTSDNPVQLLLTDAHMPHADGFWLIEQIRQDKALKSLTAMILTSGEAAGDFDRSESLQVNRFMTKPVKQSELLDSIGSAFDITAVMQQRSAADDQPVQHLRGLKILLAEDSLPNQKLAIGLLSKLGHDVHVANDGVAALDKWKSQHFDLILMDVQMPHMDGLEATRLIRKREEASRRHIPIIAMTAHAMRGDQELCLNSGMDAYVAKPIRPEDLFSTIDSFAQEIVLNRPTPAPAILSQRSPKMEINWPAALDVVQQDKDLLREVVDAVLEEVPQLMTNLHQAIQAGDKPTVQRMAHTVKGNMRTFQAESGMKIAETLEQQAREGVLENAPGLAEQLAKKVDAFVKELKESPYASDGKST
ncbi:MAG: response regulator [Planctomycetaceae bacterium]|nr:response regulator [Planctomycetaceae bacterium]